MRDHLAVTQFASGTKVGKHTFPMRNRTMALLSDATVIIEAKDGSGSLHQGWEAIRLGRPLFLAKSLFDDDRLQFPRELERYGAEVLTEESLAVLIEQLPQGPRGATTGCELVGQLLGLRTLGFSRTALPAITFDSPYQHPRRALKIHVWCIVPIICGNSRSFLNATAATSCACMLHLSKRHDPTEMPTHGSSNT